MKTNLKNLLTRANPTDLCTMEVTMQKFLEYIMKDATPERQEAAEVMVPMMHDMQLLIAMGSASLMLLLESGLINIDKEMRVTFADKDYESLEMIFNLGSLLCVHYGQDGTGDKIKEVMAEFERFIVDQIGNTMDVYEEFADVEGDIQ